MTSAPPPEMPEDVRIRPMRWWDVEPVVQLDQLLFGPDAWAPELFWAELSGTGRHYWVAVEDTGDRRSPGGPVIGFGGLALAGPEADVQTIGVDPAAQGRRIGRALMTTLIGAAKELGAGRLTLEVREDGIPARRLYESLGFTQLARRSGYYAGGVAALLMRLDVRAG